MTSQQAQQIADTIQTLRAQLKVAWESAEVLSEEECLQDAIGHLDECETQLLECDLIPVVDSK